MASSMRSHAPAERSGGAASGNPPQRWRNRRSACSTTQGFEQTTVEEIAAAAGVSTRTFFLHFPTKAAAAFPDHGERVDDFVARLNDGAPLVNPLSHLRSVLLAGFDTTSPSRLTRYALLSKVPELRDEDARTDRDYEAGHRRRSSAALGHRARGRRSSQRHRQRRPRRGARHAGRRRRAGHRRPRRHRRDPRPHAGYPFDEPLHSM